MDQGTGEFLDLLAQKLLPKNDLIESPDVPKVCSSWKT